MENTKRSDEIRRKLILFLNTDEAKHIFEKMDFKKDNEFRIGGLLKIEIYENTPTICNFSIRNNSLNGYREFNSEINI